MQIVCTKCGRSFDEGNFYTYQDGSKVEMCKKCLTMHIDNDDPKTYVWLLEKMDVPYIPGEWNVLRDRAYEKNPDKMTGMSVFGKYLAKMKLKQWKDYRWADTEKLQKEMEAKKIQLSEEQQQAQDELKEKYAAGEISEAQYKTLMSMDEEHQKKVEQRVQRDAIGANNQFREDLFLDESELGDPAAELTKEDRIYLSVKWGREYTPMQQVKLEQKYNEMMNSFDIQDSDSIGTLILTCKTFLKMNEAIDGGDFEGFQKLSRVYDSLRKSAKFTAAQNKADKGDYVDCIGQLVLMAEKEGFIPRFCTDVPQDKVDATLQDNNKYVYKLVTQDLGFGQQIEDTLKKIQIQKEMRERDDDFELDDQDIADFYEDLADQREQDQAMQEGNDD